MPNPPCPSCDQELHLTPQRKGKCKACGETFILNKDGQLFGPLVTEKQSRVEYWFRQLGYHTGGVRGFRKMEQTLTERFGFKPPPNDVIWGLFQEGVMKRVPGLHFSMAQFLVEERKSTGSARQRTVGRVGPSIRHNQ